MDNNFSKTLKFLKNKKGVTDEKIAEYLGVSRQAVTSYFTGKALPRCDTIIKLADYFGVSCDFLLTGVEPQDKREHQELNLSGVAIKKIKECDSEILPLVDNLLSDNEFYEGLLDFNAIIKFYANVFLARFNEPAIKEKASDIIETIIKSGVDPIIEYFSKFAKKYTQVKEMENAIYGAADFWNGAFSIPISPKSSHPAPSDAQP
ncbi:MAG: helix-turn-helix transcriptional regulator [Synergistaceae bacterium]|nr:helix-turn-helix transcriptional regulator [Synergistaceae bacterium]